MRISILRLFKPDERSCELSANGYDQELLNKVIDLDVFRPALKTTVPHTNRAEGRRSPFDAVRMFKTLILHVVQSPSDERTGYRIKDRFPLRPFLDHAMSH